MLPLLLLVLLQAQSAAPVLLPRAATPQDPADMMTEARILAPTTIPPEASGLYSFEHNRDSVEVDFEPQGLAGYMTVPGDADTDKGVPITFFFAQTSLDGDHLHWVTHEVHRTRYEFDGTLTQTPPPARNLQATFAMEGMLTTHHLQPSGPDRTEQRHVMLKRSGGGR